MAISDFESRNGPRVEAFLRSYLEGEEEILQFAFSRSPTGCLIVGILAIISGGALFVSELLMCLTNLRLLTCRVRNTGTEIILARKNEEIQCIWLDDILSADFRRNALRGTLELGLKDGRKIVTHFYFTDNSLQAQAIAKAISARL